MKNESVPIRLEQCDVAARLGETYRRARLLRRLLKLLDEAQRLDLPLTTALQLPAVTPDSTKGAGHE